MPCLDTSALAGTTICAIISRLPGYLGAVRRSSASAYKDEDGREKRTLLKYCQSSQEAADRSYTPPTSAPSGRKASAVGIRV